ncbi:MAG: hypothetical protein ISS35_08100 [Kiritimatiellae bacterium]|nr:hypothetical protein [Kiritimatiellia bacterium]
MLACAAHARPWLAHSAADIVTFVKGQLRESGQFANRANRGDLYYTIFGLDCLLALGQKLSFESRIRAALVRALKTDTLDLLHLAGLARCWSRLTPSKKHDVPGRLAQCVAGYATADGGYAVDPVSGKGSVYGCFLAVSALLDVGMPIVDANGVLACVARLAQDDGAYVDGPGVAPSTNAAVGATLIQSVLAAEPSGKTLCWLADRYCSGGGFFAGPSATAPDMVSTATALFALRMAGVSLDAYRDGCREFVSGLWDDAGGFCGHCLDELPDCEHTFDALLVLGCLEE